VFRIQSDGKQTVEIWCRNIEGKEYLFLRDDLLTSYIAGKVADQLEQRFPATIEASWVVEL